MSRDRAVVVTLKGGVGNQLFQYVAGRQLGQDLGATVGYRCVGSNEVRLDDLLDSAIAAPAAGAMRSLTVPHRWWGRSTGRLRYERQEGDAFASRPPSMSSRQLQTVVLDGYFQHPTWYADSLDDVAGQLKVRLARVVDPLVGRGATVISFRRSDYIRNGWDLPMSYYEQALELVPRTGGPVWVIGDDQVLLETAAWWLRERRFEVRLPPPGQGSRRMRDLALLAAADTVVMSNSTFCWWGVVAGDHAASRVNRTVVAPASWVASFPAASVMIQPGWRTIE